MKSDFGGLVWPYRFSLFENAAIRLDDEYGRANREFIAAAEVQKARSEISSWPDYVPTPLLELSGLANASGIANLFYKDEGLRFGLGSFKALGGSYAVCRVLQAHVAEATGTLPTSQELRSGTYRDLTTLCTVTAATDGNHGRSVAWGAEIFGCKSVIYVPRQCSQARQDAIEGYKAQVRRTSLGYDQTVHTCSQDAKAYGYTIVSDTSWQGYEKIPATIMQGYAVMSGEAMEQLGSAIPTHVFLQAGVGGMAAAVCAHFRSQWGSKMPRTIIVEPEGAACLYASALAGKPNRAKGQVSTIMAGLDCGEPSRLAWNVLAENADFFVTVPDEVVVDCMKMLATPPYGDCPIVAGESAIAGLAALLCLNGNSDARKTLDLTSRSRVLLFGTEGDTDPCLYERLTGESGAAARRRARAFLR